MLVLQLKIKDWLPVNNTSLITYLVSCQQHQRWATHLALNAVPELKHELKNWIKINGFFLKKFLQTLFTQSDANVAGLDPCGWSAWSLAILSLLVCGLQNNMKHINSSVSLNRHIAVKIVSDGPKVPLIYCITAIYLENVLTFLKRKNT